VCAQLTPTETHEQLAWRHERPYASVAAISVAVGVLRKLTSSIARLTTQWSGWQSTDVRNARARARMCVCCDVRACAQVIGESVLVQNTRQAICTKWLGDLPRNEVCVCKLMCGGDIVCVARRVLPGDRIAAARRVRDDDRAESHVCAQRRSGAR
jgi:hypothetical protein